jgi:cell wall-associated NlpC family hydrolase
MTTPLDGMNSVLARIQQLQTQFPQLAPRTAGTTAGVANSAASFAAALSSAQTGATGSTSATGSPAGSPTGADVVAAAKKYLGVPYVFGGTTAQGLDCSGLVQKAYGDLGIQLPRLSWDQAKAGTAVPDLAHAQPGDILGFGSPAEHVAIYLGNNMMIAAPQPGENVKIQSVYETPASIRRIVSNDAGSRFASAAYAASGASSLYGAGQSASSAIDGLGNYSAEFTQNEQAFGLPSGLLAAVARTESGGNALAVSPAGAQGLMQLMPSTAAGLGVDPFDPTQAVRGAAQLLSGYLHKYSSVPLALAAYNAGPGAVDQYNGVPPYAETQNYVAKITALMAGTS